MPLLHNPLHLEESPQPPNLENRLADDNAQDEDVPPLDTAVGALGSVAVGTFAEDNVLLLVPDLGEEIGKFLDYKQEKRVVSKEKGGKEDKEKRKGGRIEIGFLSIPSASRGSCGESDSDT